MSKFRNKTLFDRDYIRKTIRGVVEKSKIECIEFFPCIWKAQPSTPPTVFPETKKFAWVLIRISLIFSLIFLSPHPRKKLYLKRNEFLLVFWLTFDNPNRLKIKRLKWSESNNTFIRWALSHYSTNYYNSRLTLTLFFFIIKNANKYFQSQACLNTHFVSAKQFNDLFHISHIQCQRLLNSRSVLAVTISIRISIATEIKQNVGHWNTILFTPQKCFWSTYFHILTISMKKFKTDGILSFFFEKFLQYPDIDCNRWYFNDEILIERLVQCLIICCNLLKSVLVKWTPFEFFLN